MGVVGTHEVSFGSRALPSETPVLRRIAHDRPTSANDGSRASERFTERGTAQPRTVTDTL